MRAGSSTHHRPLHAPLPHPHWHRFENLRKTIAYTLTHAMPEIWPVVLTLCFGLPLALPGLLILTVDLLTEQVRQGGGLGGWGHPCDSSRCTTRWGSTTVRLLSPLLPPGPRHQPGA